MKSLLAQLPHKQVLAILLGDASVSATAVAFTPFGPSIVDHVERPLGDDLVENVVLKLLEDGRIELRRKSIPVVVGLSTLRVFFSSRPATALNRAATAQVQLHEMLKCSTLNIDDMDVDMIRRTFGKSTLASIVACRKKTLAPIVQVLQEHGVTPLRVEPEPCALLREAIRLHKSPRKAKIVLRIVLGADSALAILAANDAPVLWRSASLERGRELQSVLALVRCVEKIAPQAGLDAPLDALMIHGRPDLGDFRSSSEWTSVTIPGSRHDAPSLIGVDVALGLAAGSSPQSDAFNLARSIAPGVPLWRRVPWGQLVAQAGLMAAGGMLLGSNLAELDAARASVAARRGALPNLKSQTIPQLQKEKAELSERLEIIQGFMRGRIVWTSHLREVAEQLPPDMSLVGVDGRCDYRPDPKGRETPKSSRQMLTLTVAAPIPKGEAVPREIDNLLNSLRKNKMIRESLPVVELGNLRWGGGGTERGAVASFSVVCMPRPIPPPKTAGNAP